MSDARLALTAYISTLAAIVLLTLSAVLIVMQFDGTDGQLAKVLAALAFIGATTTGLIGVIGTFRPKASATASTESGNVNLNGSEGEN